MVWHCTALWFSFSSSTTSEIGRLPPSAAEFGGAAACCPCFGKGPGVLAARDKIQPVPAPFQQLRQLQAVAAAAITPFPSATWEGKVPSPCAWGGCSVAATSLGVELCRALLVSPGHILGAGICRLRGLRSSSAALCRHRASELEF